jgi:predicted deacylase
MQPHEFELRHFARGRKHYLDIDVSAGDHRISVPILLLRGARDGKVLVAMAGVHGDEYEGVQAILDVCTRLDPAGMAGDLLAVSVANPPALWAGTRTSPLDGADLARSFPGDLESGPSRALAHSLANTVIACADLFLDLHSAGIRLLMPTMVGYDARDPRSLAAARAFGAKVLWGHPVVAPGRTISFARERGIPWLYTEARGAGRIDPEDLQIFEQGILNLLVHLSILPGQPAVLPVEHHLLGDGNTEISLRSTRQGFLIPSVSLLERVKEGQDLGRLLDLHANTIETYVAPSEGVVAMIRQFPVVEPGTPLFLLTGLEAEN